jgi:quercetin dioxygenase-like cupin family protein
MTTPITTAPTPLLELGGATVIEHVSGEQTAGAFATLEFRVTNGAPTPPTHVHEHEDELSYVIEGALEVTVGDTTHLVRAGETIVKPRGIPHRFATVGDQPVRFLETVVPAGFDGYFRDVAAAVDDSGSFDRDLANQLMTSYGVHTVS